MTDAERALWRLLREAFPEAHFRRQTPLRHYVADFASHRARLVIEVDGGQHGGIDDDRRTAIIAAEGYRVIRFWNSDVIGNPDGVIEAIGGALLEHNPTPTSPHRGEGLGAAH